MALQNIGAGNRDDAFYRYKMPRLVTKIEGRGNGIKTNVVNMVDVAKALARPPAYTTKFFGCELGAQSKYDDKTGTSIVNGAHETAKLAGLLEIFIKKYVQCYGCGNPETSVLISKSQHITLKCAACGYVSDVDMRDKLTTFILKNPPETGKKAGKKESSLRRAEKERLKEGEIADKAKKELKKKKSHDDGKHQAQAPAKKSGSGDELSSQGDEEEVAEVAEDDGVEWATDTSVEAAQRRIQEQLTSAATEMVMSVDEERPPSPSTKAPKDGKSKLSKKSPSLKRVTVAVEEPADAPVEEMEALSLHSALVNEFKDLLQKGTSPSELASLLQKKDDTPQEAVNAYVVALFGDFHKGISKEVAMKKLYLEHAAPDEASQLRLLVALEAFCAPSPPDVGKEIALVLKVLYDDDILEEDQIIEWFDKIDAEDTQKMFVKKHAQPFVDWLKEAEDADEDDA